MSKPKTLLKALIDQRQWTWADFEREFAQAAERVIGQGARNPTVGETQYRRWTGGRLRGLPSAEACRVLQDMFGVEASRLFKPPPQASESAVAQFDLEDEIAMTAREAQDDAAATAASSVSDLTVDQLRDDVYALARGYSQELPHVTWRKAKALRELAESHRDRTAVPAQLQELLVIAGQASALMSTAAFDLGSFDGAKRLARTAALYGETARFEPLQAYAAGNLAYIAYYSGEQSQAPAHARRALTYAGLGATAMRRLHAIEARAYGHLGDMQSALRALHLSQETGGDRKDDLHDAVGGEFGFTPERLAMSNASTALLLGDGPTAESAALRALELMAALPPRQRSPEVFGKAAADLAMARLLSNNLAGAAEAIETMLSTVSPHRGTGLVTRAMTLRRVLAQRHWHGTAMAADLGERLEEFARFYGQGQLVSPPYESPVLDA
ncbi:DNA-binding protein [Streptomyces sp. NBC_01022]|uniref:DNA-binding protein n=1 Tax=Streptomyces sp. NBC_01022 TaxID=2903723 RepID=UPI002DDC47C9|nr:DNA-binding protein [Streptomyces sp. NBC_01022]WRZ79454.1 DNA-binding protein [Streptomyces sp. NBC_01022]WRZ86222.1 DNA-binding protein [Streptomyces sp. NBC_01022]